MENNNQMKQFFVEQEAEGEQLQPKNVVEQAPNLQYVQPQTPQFEQPVQQPNVQQESVQTFGAQPQFNSFQNMNQSFVSNEITPEMKKKFTTASNIALVGGVILILTTIVRIIIDFLSLAEINNAITLLKQIADRNGEDISSIAESQFEFQTAVIFGFIVLIIVVLFTVLAFFIRKAKRKTIGINLIVFSGIFILLLLIGAIFVSSNMEQFNDQIKIIEKSAIYLSGKDSLDAKAVVLNFKNISGQISILLAISFISIVGWSCMLIGGILRVNVKDNKPVVKW